MLICIYYSIYVFNVTQIYVAYILFQKLYINIINTYTEKLMKKKLYLRNIKMYIILKNNSIK